MNRVRLALLVGGSFCLIVGSIAYYYGRVLPDLRRAAGVIELERLKTSINGESVYGPAAGSGNAAAHYMLALNSYATRRIPFLKNRGYRAFVSEPPVTAAEINNLELGTKRRNCNFYEERNLTPLFRFARPGRPSWPLRPPLTPDEERPYYTPLRLMLVGLMYQAEGLKRTGKSKDALHLYGLVARVGAHVRQKPGCMLDLELGVELESRALAKIASMLKPDPFGELPSKVALYRKSVADLEGRLRRKYRQLDNPEASAIIAVRDKDPLWRIEAAAALRDQSYHHALGYLEKRTIQQALDRARLDSNSLVRKAVTRIANSKPQTATDDRIRPL